MNLPELNLPISVLVSALTFDQALGLFNYWIVIFLMMTGFYIVIARNNLIKTIIGLNIFQTSVFLLYITMGKIEGGEAPIIPADRIKDHSHGHEHGEHADNAAHAMHHATGQGDVTNGVTDSALETPLESAADGVRLASFEDVHAPADTLDHAVQAAEPIYSNPLPSVLMLTAIVVGIATTALALALIVRIREDYGTIEEDEILELDRVAGE